MKTMAEPCYHACGLWCAVFIAPQSMCCVGGQVLWHGAFLNHATDLGRASIFDIYLFHACGCVQAHGSVLSCQVLCDRTNRSKQVAFVQMETHQQAVRSMEALHGMTVRLLGMHVSDQEPLSNSQPQA